MKGQVVRLRQYVEHGEVQESDFDLSDVEVDEKLGEGSILCRILYLSVDPYMRGRMKDIKGYLVPPFKPGDPIASGGVAEVLESKHADFPKGSTVIGSLPWQTPVVINPKSPATQVRVLDNPHNFPLSYFVGVLGMPGWTAFTPLRDIGKPKEGEVVFVTGAAGAVGQGVCQLAKLLYKCKVIASAGSDDKVAFLKEQLKVDAAFNYKTKDTAEALRELAPEGIDIYWDNVGGKTLEDALNACNQHARVVCCGAIAGYNAKLEDQYGVRNLFTIVTKRLLMQGFIIGDYPIPTLFESIAETGKLIASGQYKVVEDVVDSQGLQSAGAAFCGMMRGENLGKRVIKVL